LRVFFEEYLSNNFRHFGAESTIFHYWLTFLNNNYRIRAMAVIERISLTSVAPLTLNEAGERPYEAPGLRISVRSTSSSLSDYPEWRLDSTHDSVVSDGACS
jgi:hypothetical protein